MAAAKKRFIIQKRISLDTQITDLQILFDGNELENNNLKMRLSHLKDLFYNYEDLNDQLAIMDPAHESLSEFRNLQSRFYSLASQIETKISSVPVQTRGVNNEAGPSTSSRRVKLPIAKLPTFDGKYEEWFPFKNTFIAMIDARDDTNDLEKFIYLQSSLSGDALKKISVFQPSAESYKLAWEALTKAYEREETIKLRHLSAIYNMPAINKVSHDNLIKFVDEMQQHTAILNSLDVHIGNEMLVNIILEKIPRFLVDKCKENLKFDKIPEPSVIFQYISEFAYRLFERDQASSSSKRESNSKDDYKNKARRNEQGARVFLTNTSQICILCKNDQHPLYMCNEFAKLSISERWNVVKTAKLCANCLRIHRGVCKSINCKMCNKRHHTSLHQSNSNTQTETDNAQSNRAKKQ